MKDSQGNEFGVGDVLVSSQDPEAHSGVTCIAIESGIVRLRWNDDVEDYQEFEMKEYSMGKSFWILKPKEVVG